MDNETYFKENTLVPTGFCNGQRIVSFSMSRELFKRDEIEVKKLVSKYGLSMLWFNPSIVTFRLKSAT